MHLVANYYLSLPDSHNTMVACLFKGMDWTPAMCSALCQPCVRYLVTSYDEQESFKMLFDLLLCQNKATLLLIFKFLKLNCLEYI